MVRLGRTLAVVFALAAAAAAGSSCSVSSVDLSQCDYVVTRCQPVYSTWCDGYGCYPTYYEQCWQDCYVNPTPPAPPPADAAVPPVDAAPPPPVTDAGPPASEDAGEAGGPLLLCSECRSNDECGPGGLCIVRGGGAAAAGFCGRACTGTAASSDCPAGYECAAIGSSRQCLPASGTCP